MWQTHQDRSLDLFGFAEADVALQIMRPQDQSEDPIFRAARLQVCFVLILLPCRRRNWMELARPKNDIHEETCHRNSSDRCSFVFPTVSQFSPLIAGTIFRLRVHLLLDILGWDLDFLRKEVVLLWLSHLLENGTS